MLAPTSSVASALRGRGLRDVRVWGRGVDSDQFTPDKRDEELRAHLLGDGDTLLLSVGRVSHEKRLDHLLQAFARVSRVRPGVRLLVVGDGPARRDLERTSPLGVTFHGEARGEELARLFAAADVFCFSSTTDTFGQVLLEAAASGVPVVASAAGGALDVVRGGETGVHVPVDDPGAFAAALLDLVDSPRLRTRYAEAARRHALRQSWDAALAELGASYRLACTGDRSQFIAAA